MQESGAQIYPVNKDQADKFLYGVIKELHATDEYVKMLQDKRAPISIRIGALAARALVNMFQRVKEQTGLPAGKDFVIHAIKFIVSEIATMAAKMGEKPTKQDMTEAIRLAGDNLEQTMSGTEQPQQQQPGLMAEQQQGVM